MTPGHNWGIAIDSVANDCHKLLKLSNNSTHCSEACDLNKGIITYEKSRKGWCKGSFLKKSICL